MKKSYALCATLFSIVFSCSIYAQSWQPLGPDDSNQPSFIGQAFTAMAINSNGIPYVAFLDEHVLTVKKFEGGVWALVGTPATYSTVTYDPAIAIDGNNTPYIVYQDPANSYKTTVQKFNGTSWEIVGAAGFSQGMVGDISIAIDHNNVPYVVYLDGANSYTVAVKKFDGANWVNVGTPGFTPAQVPEVSMTIDASNALYVVYPDPTANNNYATVKRFGGTTWATVGTAGFSESAFNTSIAINPVNNGVYVMYENNSYTPVVKKLSGSSWVNITSTVFPSTNALVGRFTIDKSGTVYVGYSDGIDGPATVKKLSGSSWVSVGTNSIIGSPHILTIKTDLNGTPYIAYDDIFMGYKSVVKKFDGSDWNTLGITGFSPSGADDLQVKIDAGNTPYVVYEDVSNSKITVKKYNSGTWADVGTAGFSAGGAFMPSIDLGTTGLPYVVYQDAANGSKATVQKFDGTAWQTLGTAGFSAGMAYFTRIAVDANNMPYVVYQDVPDSYKATVKKFDGANWVTVGSDGFSAGKVEYTYIAIAADGTPYVAYADDGNAAKVTVKKFDGANWVTVGTEGFSAADVTDVSIVFDKNNIPYVAYEYASGNISIPTVKKFNGTTWVDVGADISTTSGEGISLAFNAANVPYVVYTDDVNNEKATVKKFDGTNWIVVGVAGFTAGEAYSTSIAIGSNNNPVVVYNMGDAFAKTIIESTLPLTLLEFKGSLVNNDALLNWKTTGEENTKEFIVERSLDGHRFNSIGSVSSTNKTGSWQYNFTDKNVKLSGAPVVYYRLRQTDIDDHFTYSRIVTLLVDQQTSRVLLYPNPVNSETGITITVAKAEQIQMQLVNNAGRLLQAKQLYVSAGSTSISLDMSSLSKGIYFLTIKGSSVNKQITVVKQ